MKTENQDSPLNENSTGVKTKTKLNVGCGSDLLPGYINVDRRDSPTWMDTQEGYIHADLTDLGATFPDNFADEVRAIYVLEHFDYAGVMHVLFQLWKVLLPSALIRIAVPNFEALVGELNVERTTPELQPHLINLKVFSTEAETLHKSVWTEQSARHYMMQEGLWKNITVKKNKWNRFDHVLEITAHADKA